MRLERRTVVRDHVLPLIGLSVAPGQADLVGDNAKTLAQAPFETGSEVWGLWLGDDPVGLMALVDPRRYPWIEPEDDPGAAYLWRLMIDVGRQGQGLGRQAVAEALDVARQWGLPRLSASVVDRPGGPLPFYEALGFRRTGRIADGEAVIVRDVG